MTILLTSNDTPLPSGAITMDQASWITSLLSIGALFSNIVFGFLANNFGRKILLLLIGIPMIVSIICSRQSKQNQFNRRSYVLYLDQLGNRMVCAGSILFIYIQIHWWIFWSRRLHDYSNIFDRGR